MIPLLDTSGKAESSGNRPLLSSGGNRRRGNVVDPAQVEQISQMFPQLSTRDIMWDLQRNGGNVAATTERILTGRGLETDLISRYNLRAKLAEGDDAQSAPNSSSGWSQNKEERQRLLQKRRDDMILAARKRMMQKVQESS
ncbi:hypothetical protein ATERTT37_002767 [Aspergillus terreus]